MAAALPYVLFWGFHERFLSLFLLCALHRYSPIFQHAFAYFDYFAHKVLKIFHTVSYKKGFWLFVQVHYNSTTHICNCFLSIIHGAVSWLELYLSGQVEGPVTGLNTTSPESAATQHWLFGFHCMQF